MARFAHRWIYIWGAVNRLIGQARRAIGVARSRVEHVHSRHAAEIALPPVVHRQRRRARARLAQVAQNVLSFLIGPPIDPPNSFRINVGLGWLTVLKKFRAARA